MQYMVNGATLQYEVEGDCTWGSQRVLLHDAVDLTSGLPWEAAGFSVEPMFDLPGNTLFHQQTKTLLTAKWRAAGLAVNDAFSLDQYHTLVPDFDAHVAAIAMTKYLPVSSFPVPIENLEARISEILNVDLCATNPFDGESCFHFRIIRPAQSDNNPLHRDVWLEDYKDCINLYIPVAGSSPQSSLILLPGSHQWPESRIERTVGGATINGIKFNVPAVTAIQGTYKMERPSPGMNEMLLFSPYLIHGGAVNLSASLTRISIELRLWKK